MRSNSVGYIMQNHQVVYRIGLFGRANAGKTSLLLALSKIKHATVEGQTWTIDYLPPVDGAIADTVLLDKLKRGYDLLQKVEKDVQVNGNPRPGMEIDNTTLYRFQVACDGSVRVVELCDYAGEILTPNRLENVESHGHELAKRISRCDAVFVLAPASDKSDESNVDAERSKQVAESLARLHAWIKQNDPLGSTHKRPYGLLVTKIDRVSSPSNVSAEALGTPAKQVWEKVQALHSESFTRWFGLTMLPKNGAEPTGLIGPIVWAMDKADHEILEVAKKDDGPGWLAWLQSPLKVYRAKRTSLRQLDGLLGRRHAMSGKVDSFSNDALEVQSSLRRSVFGYLTTVALGLFCTASMAFFVYDAMRSSRYQRIAEDPQSDEVDLGTVEKYFTAYNERFPSLNPFGLSKDQAVELREKARDNIAEKLWDEIEKEPDPVKKGELADRYRGKKRAEEAKRLVAAGKQEQDRRLYVKWFDEHAPKSELDTLSVDDLTKLRESLSVTPAGLKEAPEQETIRKEWLNKIDGVIITFSRQDFVDQVESLVRRQRPFEALGLLGARPDSLEWDEMKPTLALLKANWTKDINAQLSEWKKGESYSTAIQTLQTAIRDRELIPKSANIPADPVLNDLIVDVTNDWDKTDYNHFKQSPSISAAEEYLLAAHDRCMRQTVESWKSWKENEGSPRSLSPYLESITWDRDKGATNPLVDLYVNGKQFMNKAFAGNGGYGETYRFPSSNSSLKISPGDRVNVRVVLWNDNIDWYGDSLVGQYEDTFPFSDLTSSDAATGRLTIEDNKAVHQFRIRLLGMPEAPELPEWTSCQ